MKISCNLNVPLCFVPQTILLSFNSLYLSVSVAAGDIYEIARKKQFMVQQIQRSPTSAYNSFQFQGLVLLHLAWIDGEMLATTNNYMRSATPLEYVSCESLRDW